MYIEMYYRIVKLSGDTKGLNSVSSQSACGKSSTAQKPEGHPKIFKL